MKLLKNTPLEGTRVDQKNTPRFWKRVRNWALIIAAVAGTVATGGAGLPVLAVTIAGTVATVATTVAAVAATTNGGEEK